ncbi:GvpL/GvpF family gas vesicle protein [Xylanimonas sp. McL0601]|uniref:GvpL/GvpF family gas vesicle protein n=1 Tax=Xylanimonas sp. McL0601 TaxID=3414739 RepID=UPI003CFABF18
MTATTSEQVLYLYGLVQHGAAISADLIGVGREPVRTVSAGDVDAVVSDLSPADQVATAAAVRAHAGVLDAVAAEAPVLPVRFGTTASDVENLVAELADEDEADYADQLRRLRDLVQLSVRARYVRDQIMAELLEEEPEIAQLRDATRDQPEDAMYYDRIRLGELVVAGFERKRAADAPAIEEVVAAHATELRHRPESEVETVLDVAVLVPRSRVTRFEDALDAVAEQASGRIVFRLVGPQPPYDFVEP